MKNIKRLREEVRCLNRVLEAAAPMTYRNYRILEDEGFSPEQILKKLIRE